MKARKKENLIKRHRRVRVKIKGTKEVPRLSVFISNRYIYTQLIDDVEGRTLASASTLEKSCVDGESRCSIASAERLGTILAERALERGIQKLVFDRGGFRYHGRVKAIAESARKSGLVF